MIPESSRLEFLENFQQPIVLYQMQRTTPLGREIEQGIANLSLLRTLLAKSLEITMSWLVCLRFSMSWCFSPRILMSQFFGLGISMSRFFGLGIPMSCHMCLHGLVFVIMKTKISRIIMSIMLLKNISIVQIYATSICIMYA